MTNSLPPGVILIIGALMLPALPGRLKSAWMLILPLLSGWHLWSLYNHSPEIAFELMGYELHLFQIDRLSLMWGAIFHIAAVLSALFALHVKDVVQHVSALVYAGAAIGAVFAGDLITLFVYWELTAVSSVFLIWASRNERSYRAGMRYLIVQVGSGVILLAGILLHLRDTGSVAFSDAFYKLLPTTDGFILGLNSPGTMLIFLAFGIKAAFPLLHCWLKDTYPEATVTGTVFLSAFTTKLAIYVLARGFPGTEILIWIGAIMTAFPIFFAVIENNLRRVLSYSLNNQLGFMVVGIGLANFVDHPETAEMALNGTAAHAFAHIIYKALLFMSMGAVLYRTGTINASELGGLYKSMPWTTAFCIIGAASISAFPLFSGFVTKSMILTATAERGYMVIWLVLLFASAGVMEHSGIKIPFFTFFAHDSGKRVKEAPLNMLLAMGICAMLCILIGVCPGLLYGILPYDPAGYDAYSTSHVITQLQLLFFSALAFTVLKLTAIYPPEQVSVNLDVDWIYRKPLPALFAGLHRMGVALGDAANRLVLAGLMQISTWIKRQCGIQGRFGGNWSTGTMVLCAAVLLGAYLIISYF